MNLAEEFKIYCRAVIVNSFNEILLLQKRSNQKRSNQKIASNQWLLPGGSLEFSETPKIALIRELKEEINFNATNLILLDTDLRIIDQTHWLGLLYKAEGTIQTIKNLESQKHQKLEWQSIIL